MASGLKYALISALVLIFATTGFSQGFSDDKFDLSGYVQFTPVRIQTTVQGFSEQQTWWDYRLQNRLNLKWYASQSFTFTAETRTRLFAGDLVKEVPGYSDLINTDTGYTNLSYLLADEDTWFLHFIPDRLYAEYSLDKWSFRVGRQRINWGVNMLTNPNDLFNIYSLYDFDYPERPGSDAVRIQYHLDWASRIELAWSPAEDMRNSTLAMLYGFNRNEYDIQLITGVYKSRLAVGGGWAGNLNNAGFKGELMFYYDEIGGSKNASYVAAISADYMFNNGLFAVGEIVYNDGGGNQQNYSLLGAELRADNPTFSRYQVTSQLTYAVTPLMNTGLTIVGYPDEQAVFISPNVTYSALTNLDFTMLVQFFAVGDDSIFSEAGNVLAATLKWSF